MLSFPPSNLTIPVCLYVCVVVTFFGRLDVKLRVWLLFLAYGLWSAEQGK